MKALTREYRLGRQQLSLAAAQAYFLTFWWVIAGVPLGGLLLLLLTRDPVMQVCGLISLLWPITIPARAYIVTSKSSRQFTKPTTLFLAEDALVFQANDDTGRRLNLENVYRIDRRGGLYFVTMLGSKGIIALTLAQLFVPADAFIGEAERAEFEHLSRKSQQSS
jgi:hypothetical protein